MSNFDPLFGESEFALRDLFPPNNSDTTLIVEFSDVQRKSIERGDLRDAHGNHLEQSAS